MRTVRSLLYILALGVAWMGGPPQQEGFTMEAIQILLLILGWVGIAAVMRNDLKRLNKWQEEQIAKWERHDEFTAEKWEKHDQMHAELVGTMAAIKASLDSDRARLNRIDDRVDDLRHIELRRRKSNHDVGGD